MTEEEETEPTIYDAIVSLSNPSDQEDVEQLNKFLTEKLGNFPLLFISDVITMLFKEDLPQKSYLYLLVHFSNAISTRMHPIRFFSLHWQEIMTSVAQNLGLSTEGSQLDEIVDNFHTRMINFMNDEKIEIRQNASRCVSELFYIEYMIDLWGDFFPSIFDTIKDVSNNFNILESSFSILIDLIKKQIISKEIDSFDDIILNIYDVLKIYLSNPTIDVRLRILCLKMNSKALYMLDKFFTQEEELNGYVRFLLLHLKDIPDKNVHRLVYKLLKKTFARHIENLGGVIESVFEIVGSDLQNDDEENKALAIDFWLGLAISEKDKKLHSIISSAAPVLVPVFLSFLISNQDVDRKRSIIDNDKDFEDEIEIDTETTSKNSIVIDNSIICLRYFVEAEPDIVVPLIIPFINENFNSDDHSLNMASLNASYSVLKNKNFYPILIEMMPKLLALANQEENIELQTCALFILSKALSNYPKLIGDDDCFNQLVSLVEKNISFAIEPTNSLKANKKNIILMKAFYLLTKIVKCFSDDPDMQAFLGENFDRIWSIFHLFFEKYPVYREELFLIRIVFSTLNSFISGLPIEKGEQITHILTISIKNIADEIAQCQVNPALFLSVNCSVIWTVGFKLKQEVGPFVPEIMDILFSLFAQFDEEVFTEALEVIEEFQLIFKDDFKVYQEKLIDIVGNILTGYNQINPRLVKQSIRLISMMYKFPSEDLKQKTEQLYDLIAPIFKIIYAPAPSKPHEKQLNSGIGSVICSTRMPRDILPCIIETITLITSQSNTDRKDKFVDQYANLNKAQKIKIDVSQNDDKDFAYELYEKILFAYKILIKVPDPEDSFLVMLNMNQMLMAFENIYEYCVTTRRCLDLFISILYNLVTTFKGKFCDQLKTPKYEVIKKIFDFIRESPEEVFQKKVETIDIEIQKYI